MCYLRAVVKCNSTYCKPLNRLLTWGQFNFVIVPRRIASGDSTQKLVTHCGDHATRTRVRNPGKCRLSINLASIFPQWSSSAPTGLWSSVHENRWRVKRKTEFLERWSRQPIRVLIHSFRKSGFRIRKQLWYDSFLFKNKSHLIPG